METEPKPVIKKRVPRRSKAKTQETNGIKAKATQGRPPDKRFKPDEKRKPDKEGAKVSPKGRRRSTSKALAEGRTHTASLTPGTVELLVDPDSIEEWTDEELRRGVRQRADGTWPPTPLVIATEIHSELGRRNITKAQRVLNENVFAAAAELTRIATDQQIPAKDRLPAIKMLLDRVMGSVPLLVDMQVQSTPKWMEALSGAIVDVDVEEDDPNVVDAELVDE